MKRMLFVLSILAVLSSSLFSLDNDIMRPDNSLKTAIQQDMFVANNNSSRSQAKEAPAYTISHAPLDLGANFNDYFPASYCSEGIVPANGDVLKGHWMVYHSKDNNNPTTKRRIKYVMVNESGTTQTEILFYHNSARREGFPGLDVTPSGRPMFSYHVDMDPVYGANDGKLEVVLAYDGMLFDSASSIHLLNGDLDALIDNPQTIPGYESVDDNEFLWPTVQVGPSPEAGKVRAYYIAKNAVGHVGDLPSENIVMFYKDFVDSEDLLGDNALSSAGWTMRTIPELDEWNNAGDGEFRRPYNVFKVVNDVVYYVGTHVANVNAQTGAASIDEPKLDVFRAANYGEGDWERISAYDDIHIGNPNNFSTVTGDHEGTFDTSEAGYLQGDDGAIPDENVVLSHSGPSHLTVGVDNLGRLHNLSFYIVGTTDNSWYPGIGQIVKDLVFDPANDTWYINDIYPRAETSEMTALPTDEMLSISDDGMTFDTSVKITSHFDKNIDGNIDYVLDDGTYDGEDDGVTSTDTEYWGKIKWADTQWTYQYHDEAAIDNAMTFHMSEGRMTDANEKGMMVACWPSTQKAKDYIKYPDSYPELEPYAAQVEYYFTISGDNGTTWSEPFTISGAVVEGSAVVPELEGKHLSFMYMAPDVKVVAENEDGSVIGRISLMYLNDNDYGSSVQSIGQAGEGHMEYMALDITWPAGTDNDENTVPSIASVSLGQNYPNPFNPTTTISYSNKSNGNVALDIYNMRGQLVRTLVNEEKAAGTHTVTWNGNDNNGSHVASGVYFYKVSCNGESQMKKMVLMK